MYKHSALHTACVLHPKWTAAGDYNTRRALAPGVEPRLQPLTESIQRCCRISIHVGDVDGLHYINMKLNLSTSSYCRGFLLVLPKPYCLYTLNIPPGKSSPILVGVGKERLCRRKLQWWFFPYLSLSIGSLAVGAFAVTVYWKLLGSLSYSVPCHIG